MALKRDSQGWRNSGGQSAPAFNSFIRPRHPAVSRRLHLTAGKSLNCQHVIRRTETGDTKRHILNADNGKDKKASKSISIIRTLYEPLSDEYIGQNNTLVNKRRSCWARKWFGWSESLGLVVRGLAAVDQTESFSRSFERLILELVSLYIGPKKSCKRSNVSHCSCKKYCRYGIGWSATNIIMLQEMFIQGINSDC